MVVATWPVAEDIIEDGARVGGLLGIILIVSTGCLQSGFLPVRRAAAICNFCLFVFLATLIVHWGFFGFGG